MSSASNEFPCTSARKSSVKLPIQMQLSRQRTKRYCGIVLIVGVMLMFAYIWDKYHSKRAESRTVEYNPFLVVVLYFPIYVLMTILQRVWLFVKNSCLNTSDENQKDFSISGRIGNFCNAGFIMLLLSWIMLLKIFHYLIDINLQLLYQTCFDFLIPFLLTTVIITVSEMTDGYNLVEINEAFKGSPSIGQVWGEAQVSHFKAVSKNLLERITNFEKTGVKIKLKKMIIIMPLSCNVEGTLDSHPDIFYLRDLDEVLHDQGANINRTYKNPVYEIRSSAPFYLVMESPNTALALLKIKEVYKNKNLALWEYQRDQFISYIREKLKNYPCEILIYDDTKNGRIIPLAAFLRKELIRLTRNQFHAH